MKQSCLFLFSGKKYIAEIYHPVVILRQWIKTHTSENFPSGDDSKEKEKRNNSQIGYFSLCEALSLVLSLCKHSLKIL